MPSDGPAPKYLLSNARVISLYAWFEGIDWTLLRQQKRWLLEHDTPEATGLIHLLDSLQDLAVDYYGVPAHVVFPPTENDDE